VIVGAIRALAAVGIDTRTSEGANTTIFKVRRRQGPGMAAKIRFWVDKVKEGRAPD
jgi:hypothetical protein